MSKAGEIYENPLTGERAAGDGRSARGPRTPQGSGALPGKYTEPHWERSALITIDTQNDSTLPGAPFEIPGTAEAVPVMRRLVEAFRKAGRPIVHVVRLYRPDGSNADLCRKEAVEEGTILAMRSGADGAELVDELKPSPEVRLDAELLLDGGMQEVGESEWIMYKPRWGAFYETPLHRHLKTLAQTPSSSADAISPTVHAPRATKLAKGTTGLSPSLTRSLEGTSAGRKS